MAVTGPSPFYALTLLKRELRADLTHFGFFLACLVLGAGAIAAVGSLAAATMAGIRADAKTLLGGDIEVSLANRPLDPQEERFLAASGKLSAIVTLQAMARTAGGESPIALKAVDSHYPLYGTLALSPPGKLEALLAKWNGDYGAVTDPALLQRLSLRLGEAIRIGRARFDLRARIAREPDPLPRGLVFGPRVILSRAALAASGLLSRGTLASYRYRLRLPAGESAKAWVRKAHTLFPRAGWRIRTAAEAAPRLRRLLDRVALFLRLIAFLALVIGGIGIGNAVASHLTGKRETIATLKCLGASSGLIVFLYLSEVLALALLGIAFGVLLGASLPFALRPFLAPLLPIGIAAGIYPAPLLSAVAAGLFMVLAFSIPPLAGLHRISPAALFRAGVEPPRLQTPLRKDGSGLLRRLLPQAVRRNQNLPALFASVLAASAVLALAVLGGSDRRAAFYFAGAISIALALFAAAGTLLGAAARRFGRPRLPMLRLALANLGRPGAPATRILLSLGLSLAFFIAMALVERNLVHEIEWRIPARAPAFFFIDITPAERAAFAAIVHSIPGTELEMVPMLRGRIAKVNGVPVKKAKIAGNARWAVDSDRGLTYASRLPKGSVLAEGTWWPQNYSGPPLVSMDEGIARGMGLRVGDTITVEVLGRAITARIANLRRIDWSRLGINFVLVFAPGALEQAPYTDLATVSLPRKDEGVLLARVSRRFPEVSAIPVREALEAVARILAKIAAAVEAAALATLLAGTLVVAGAIASTQAERTRDAVLLKILGARRSDIARAFLIEHAILGGLAGLLACAIGILVARFVVERFFGGGWVLFPGLVLAAALFATVTSLALGFLATLSALGKRPAAVLRGE